MICRFTSARIFPQRGCKLNEPNRFQPLRHIHDRGPPSRRPHALPKSAAANGLQSDNVGRYPSARLALNPSFADGWYWSGWLHLFAGQADMAIQHFEGCPRDRSRGLGWKTPSPSGVTLAGAFL
jgi:hypothetical protein